MERCYFTVQKCLSHCFFYIKTPLILKMLSSYGHLFSEFWVVWLWVKLEWLFFHILLTNFTPNLFLESKSWSPTYWPVSPPICLPLTLLHATTVPIAHTHFYFTTITHPRTHKHFPILGWREYPMVHCNGTSRWSLIGLDHGTSLGSGCEILVCRLNGVGVVLSRLIFELFLHFFLIEGKLFMLVTWNKRKLSPSFFTLLTSACI